MSFTSEDGKVVWSSDMELIIKDGKIVGFMVDTMTTYIQKGSDDMYRVFSSHDKVQPKTGPIVSALLTVACQTYKWMSANEEAWAWKQQNVADNAVHNIQAQGAPIFGNEYRGIIVKVQVVQSTVHNQPG